MGGATASGKREWSTDQGGSDSEAAVEDVEDEGLVGFGAKVLHFVGLRAVRAGPVRRYP
mgnify:CR=1 FL=1